MLIGLVAIRGFKHGIQEAKTISATVFIMCFVAYDGDDLHTAHVNLEEVDSGDWKGTCEIGKDCFMQLRKLMRA